MLVYIKAKEKGEVIDFREAAPKGAHPGLFRGDPEKGIRGTAIIFSGSGRIDGGGGCWLKHPLN